MDPTNLYRPSDESETTLIGALLILSLIHI